MGDPHLGSHFWAQLIVVEDQSHMLCLIQLSFLECRDLSLRACGEKKENLELDLGWAGSGDAPRHCPTLLGAARL